MGCVFGHHRLGLLESLKEFMKKPIEPFLWSLFGAGGTIAALVLPALVFFNGIAVGLGWLEAPTYERLLSFMQHPIARLFLFVIISLPLFHWGHRFRYTLYDGLQLKHLNKLIAVFCYGGAMLGTLLAGYKLLTL